MSPRMLPRRPGVAASQDAAPPPRAGSPRTRLARWCTAKNETSFYERASNKNWNGSITAASSRSTASTSVERAVCPSKGKRRGSVERCDQREARARDLQHARIRAWYGDRNTRPSATVTRLGAARVSRRTTPRRTTTGRGSLVRAG